LTNLERTKAPRPRLVIALTKVERQPSVRSTLVSRAMRVAHGDREALREEVR
jgi:hypothetical protein